MDLKPNEYCLRQGSLTLGDLLSIMLVGVG